VQTGEPLKKRQLLVVFRFARRWKCANLHFIRPNTPTG